MYRIDLLFHIFFILYLYSRISKFPEYFNVIFNITSNIRFMYHNILCIILTYFMISLSERYYKTVNIYIFYKNNKQIILSKER